MIRDSTILRWVKMFHRRNLFRRRLESDEETPERRLVRQFTQTLQRQRNIWNSRAFHIVVLVAFCLLGIWGVMRLLHILVNIHYAVWLTLLGDTFLTFGRVVFCLVLSTAWAVPVGIWIGTSPQRIRKAQPIIQMLASFPAPMLYPLALTIFFKAGINFNFAAMGLMMLGVQWYVLFNVLAGATRIPQELKYALTLMKSSRRDFWQKLYVPSVFPNLVTGWVTAAGGAWNASIAAEYILYHGQILTARGLGATISVAASHEDFPLLAASLTVMVAVVILLNRTVWAKAYSLAQNRFRFDL
jgi:NitT/TauT family transport system permease protein